MKTNKVKVIRVILIVVLLLALVFASHVLPFASVMAEEAEMMGPATDEETVGQTQEPAVTESTSPDTSMQPAEEPTLEPSTAPAETQEPSAEPTDEPTPDPTDEPTNEPTAEPTSEPTSVPTPEPKPEARYTIRIAPPTGWRNTASAQVHIEVIDENGTGFKQIRVSTGSGWADVTDRFTNDDHIDYDVYDNGTMVVRVTDPDGGYHEEQAQITCFDRKAPTVTAGINGEPLHIETADDLSGVAGIQVNGLIFTALENGALDVYFSEALRGYEKLAIRAYDYAGNFSTAVTLDNPYYGYPAQPTATPKPTKKPSVTKSPSGGSSGSKATAKPTALPTIAPTLAPTAIPTATPIMALPTVTPAYIQTGPGQPFSTGGNMQTLDMLYSASTNKQFITVKTRSGETYFLIIDYDKPIDEDANLYETYFLNLVDDRDLLAVLSDEDKPTPTPTVAPTPVPTQAPTPDPVQTEEKPNANAAGMVFLVLVLLAGGGALWYFKLRKSSVAGKKKTVPDEYEFDEEDDMEEDEENNEDE